MRPRHKLQHNKKTETWQHMVFFDTETQETVIDGTHKLLTLKLGYAVYIQTGHTKERWCYFEQADEFLNWLEDLAKPKTRIVIFAHNLYFDFKVCLLHLLIPERGWKNTKLYFGQSGLQSFVEFRKDKKTLLFLDTMNFFSTSLEALGKTIGIKKMTINFETCSKSELARYCKNDVQVIKAGMQYFQTFLQENDLGNVQKTIASQAFTAFRHRFLTDDVWIHDNPDAITLERKAYHGGRVECFYQGTYKGPVYKLDVNSMYPAMMAQHDFPVQLIQYCKGKFSPKGLAHKLKSYGVIAYCVIDTDEECYPLKTDKRLIYPLGRFATVLCGPALEYALKKGHIRSISEIALYRMAPVFQAFVGYFWKQRQHAQDSKDETLSFFYKLFLNTLYGKFGQRTLKEDFNYEGDPADFEIVLSARHKQVKVLVPNKHGGGVHKETRIKKEAISEWHVFGRVIGFVKSEEESYNSFPAIAAYVTDYARMLLWELYQQAGAANVLYCDTDCLMVTAQGKQNLSGQIGTALGMLKVEGKAQHVEIFCPKDYVFGEEVKRKGIKKKAVWDFYTNRYEQNSFERFRGGLRSDFTNGIMVSQVSKYLARTLETRTPAQDDFTRALVVGREEG